MSRVAVLVEGESDRAAVLALATSTGVDLAARGVEVVAMGGITNIARYAAELGAAGVRLTGLYDAAEERFVRRALGSEKDLRTLGFHCCDRDLEDELIRALGVERVLEVIAGERDADSFRSLAQQPAQRDRPVAAQLHRFFGAGAGRKIRYGALLVRALAPDEVPGPLAGVLAAALS